jgi:hypothetical protein
MVADAASPFDYTRLANLGLQVARDLPRPAELRCKLQSFFTTPSLQAPLRKVSSAITNLSAGEMVTPHSQPPSSHRTGSLSSSPPSKHLPPSPTSARSDLFMSDLGNQ